MSLIILINSLIMGVAWILRKIITAIEIAMLKNYTTYQISSKSDNFSVWQLIGLITLISPSLITNNYNYTYNTYTPTHKPYVNSYDIYSKKNSLSQKLKILQVQFCVQRLSRYFGYDVSLFRDYSGRNKHNQKFSLRPAPYQQWHQ